MISPLDIVGWTFRRNPADIIRLYNSLSDVMSLATGGQSLNFGLWDSTGTGPLWAQERMALHFGQVAQLDKSHMVADVGCGRAGPAHIWKKIHTDIQLVGIDINHQNITAGGLVHHTINATSASLPLASSSIDRVLALESAQHFRPLSGFVAEAARVLKPEGLLCMALPVAGSRYGIHRLGMLWLTWSSEHHTIKMVHDAVASAGLHMQQEELVGNRVYEPLADYYVENRQTISRQIAGRYPGYVESLLYRSMLGMRKAAKQDVIEYIIVKCQKL